MRGALIAFFLLFPSREKIRFGSVDIENQFLLAREKPFNAFFQSISPHLGPLSTDRLHYFYESFISCSGHQPISDCVHETIPIPSGGLQINGKNVKVAELVWTG